MHKRHKSREHASPKSRCDVIKCRLNQCIIPFTAMEHCIVNSFADRAEHAFALIYTVRPSYTVGSGQRGSIACVKVAKRGSVQNIK